MYFFKRVLLNWAHLLCNVCAASRRQVAEASGRDHAKERCCSPSAEEQEVC